MNKDELGKLLGAEIDRLINIVEKLEAENRDLRRKLWKKNT